MAFAESDARDPLAFEYLRNNTYFTQFAAFAVQTFLGQLHPNTQNGSTCIRTEKGSINYWTRGQLLLPSRHEPITLGYAVRSNEDWSNLMVDEIGVASSGMQAAVFFLSRPEALVSDSDRPDVVGAFIIDDTEKVLREYDLSDRFGDFALAHPQLEQCEAAIVGAWKIPEMQWSDSGAVSPVYKKNAIPI